MRAHEFVQDDINPETVKPGFEKKRWYKGRYLMIARAREMDEYEDRPTKGLIIKVYDPKTTSMWFKSAGIAQARFIVIDRDHMEVSVVSVADEYQRQGIASAMYNFARELGNEIQPSKNRTPMGKAFWAAGAGTGRATPDEPPAPEPVAVAANSGATTKPGFFKRLLKLENKEQVLKQKGIQLGSLVDLSSQFVAYNSLIGQVKGFTPSGKLQILIVHAEPKTSKAQYVVGNVISMAANYINKNSVINAPK